MRNPLLHSSRPWAVEELPICETCHRRRQPDEVVRGECWNCWIKRILEDGETEELLP